MDQKLPIFKQSLTTSITESIEKSTLSIESKISQLSDELRPEIQAVSTQIGHLVRIELQRQGEIIASNHSKTLNSLHQIQKNVPINLPNHSSQNVSLPTIRRKSKRSHTPMQIDLSQCTCSAKAQVVDYTQKLFLLKLFPWSIALALRKTFETSMIHDRRCPLWYTSRKQSTYDFYLRALGLQFSGSIELENSPHTLFSGLTVSPKLKYRPVVSESSPSFKVFSRYCYITGFPQRATDYIEDLKIVFESGNGSPWDILENGDGLLNASINLFSLYSSLHLLSLKRDDVTENIASYAQDELLTCVSEY